MLLQRVRAAGGRDLNVRWRYFSLTQVNSRRPRWRVWRTRERAPGKEAFRAAEAARRQGDQAFEAFHLALLDARHVERLDIDEHQTLVAVAEKSGLDVKRFTQDLKVVTLAALERDHTEAVERYGIFGTPTFLLPGTGAAAYVRILPAPEAGAAVETFDRLLDALSRPYLLEIKRPSPPKPL